jgi:hypothetical protein
VESHFLLSHQLRRRGVFGANGNVGAGTHESLDASVSFDPSAVGAIPLLYHGDEISDITQKTVPFVNFACSLKRL